MLLSPDRWPAVEALFDAVADLPEAERARLLATADAAVAAEVRALLAAEPDAASFFDAPTSLGALLRVTGEGGADAGDEARDDLPEGTRVGPWTIGAEIGRGGMGTVYRADRADGLYAHTVALKIVRRGMDSARVVRRFETERALLASLAHDGIARLVDGGTAPDGRPYFAMDLVDGVPITAYCDAERLTVDRRIALFLDVCAAVAHAHRRLVVHRDLKPSNVLVARGEDGTARVTLLDFGVAKILAPERGALGGGDVLTGGLLTGEGPRPFTPEYAAPEQITGAPVTTAADVYALGVLLHELLTGTRPSHARTSPVPTRTGRPPALPSSRIDAVSSDARPDASADTAAARGTTTGALRHALRGDLDAICLVALREEPEARYASADALADDLRRHLAGLPVRAREGTARYVAGRFVRRHRWAALAAATLALVLVAFSAITGVQNQRIAAERDRATRERDKAQSVAAMLERLFLEMDPGGRGSSGATTVRALLDSGAARVDAVADPQARAHLLDVMARVYRAHADFPRALPMQQASVRLFAATEGPDAPETLAAEHHLAYLLEQMGRSAEAEPLYRRVLAARRASGDPDGRIESTSDLAQLLLNRGEVAEAIALAREGLAVLDAHPDAGPDGLDGPLSRASFLLLLGESHALQDDLPDAARLMREAAAIYAREVGENHVYTTATESRLARVLSRQGQHDEAVRMLTRSAAVQEAAWGPGHPWALAIRMRLADALAAAGRTRDAAAVYRETRTRAAAAGDTARAREADRRRAALPRADTGRP